MAYNLVSLATLRTRLFDRVDTARHWVNEEARLALNDTLLFWNLLTGQWRRQLTPTLVPGGDPYVALGSTIIWPMRMELSDGTLVEKTSIAALDYAIPGWEGQAIGDAGVPTSITFWAPRSLQFLVVWPRPIVATAVVFDGVSETPVLVNDGDFIDLDDGVQDVLLNYAAHLLQWKDGGAKFRSTDPARVALILAAADQNAQLKATAIYRRAAGLDTDQGHRPRVVPEEAQAAAG